MKIKTVIGLTKRVALLGLVLGVSMTHVARKTSRDSSNRLLRKSGLLQ